MTLTVDLTVFKSLNAANPKRKRMSWQEVVERVEQAKTYPTKADCPLIKLGTFGEQRTEKGSARFDDNMLAISGVEGDYDGGIVSPADAARMMREADITGLIYTSPSHTPEYPRWRVLAPFSQPVAPQERAKYVDLLNGVLGGILAQESWTLSQTFYIGRVAGREYLTYSIEGLELDFQALLVNIPSIGKNGINQTPVVSPESKDTWAWEQEDRSGVENWTRLVAAGESYHGPLRDLAAHYAAMGMPAKSIEKTLGGLMQSVPIDQHDHRWKERWSEIPKLAKSAITKFSPDVSLEDADWPEPQPLPKDLPPVPAFEITFLPDALAPWIEDISERMQIGMDIPAVGAITALSSAIGARVRIQPKREDENWLVTPNLWGVVVAPPGYMKSPALSEVMKPLRHLEKYAQREHDRALATWAAELERVKFTNSARKEEAKAKLKKAPNAIPDFQTEPEPTAPACKRFITSNFSLEALGEVLKGNPSGVLAFSDELHGLLKLAEKPGNEGLHDFLLMGWNGDSPYTFDRIVRGLRHLDNVCVSILGGIQPGRLLEYIENAAAGGGGDSGLVQRFQLLCWPDLSPEWRLVDRKPNWAAQSVVHEVFERLAGCDFTSGLDETNCGLPQTKRNFDSEAQACFFTWWEGLENLVRGESLPPVMASHLSKYRSLVPALALIFALADNVQGDIPLRYVKKAIAFAKYLRAHAERAFSCATQSHTRYARALLDKIREGKVLDGFKFSDVYLKNWSMLDGEGVKKATNLLCDFGHLRLVEKPPGSNGGRPSYSFRINPKAMN